MYTIHGVVKMQRCIAVGGMIPIHCTSNYNNTVKQSIIIIKVSAIIGEILAQLKTWLFVNRTPHLNVCLSVCLLAYVCKMYAYPIVMVICHHYARILITSGVQCLIWDLMVLHVINLTKSTVIFNYYLEFESSKLETQGNPCPYFF